MQLHQVICLLIEMKLSLYVTLTTRRVSQRIPLLKLSLSESYGF